MAEPESIQQLATRLRFQQELIFFGCHPSLVSLCELDRQWGGAQHFHGAWAWSFALNRRLVAYLLVMGLLCPPLPAVTTETETTGGTKEVSITVRATPPCSHLALKSPKAQRQRQCPEIEPGGNSCIRGEAVPVPRAQPGSGKLSGEAKSSLKPIKQSGASGPRLEIGSGAFTDEQLASLMDDWLVPLVVDGLLRGKFDEVQEG